MVCADCGQEKEHQAKGLCKPCYMRHWREEHKEERAAYQRRWRQEHRKEALAYRRRHYQEHREEYIAYMLQWQRDNPDKVAARGARRKAQKRSLPYTLTPEEAEYLLEIGKVAYPGEKLHLDHIVPLSRGGGTTLANMHAIPASLNQSKYDALPEEAYRQEALL